MFNKARIDTLYSSIDKLCSIQDDINASLLDMPFAEPDDPDWDVWTNKKGVRELSALANII